MIRLRQIKVNIDSNIEDVLLKCAKKLNIKRNEINTYKISRLSIDARKKPNLFYEYTIDIDVSNEDKLLKKYLSNDIFKTPDEEYIFKVLGNEKLNYRPIIVGSGPAGLFCAYFLAKYGYNPLIIEQGEDIDSRIKSVEKFWKDNVLNENSNVQFGEGGAGTFSDGKLNTLKKDKFNRCKKVMEIFVECGAPKEILYVNNPHIGTDKLVDVIKNMREKIKKFGGEFLFKTKLTNLFFNDGKIEKIEINNNDFIYCDVLVLAIGHSARDTFKLLHDKGINMSQKPFAVGIRIAHKREMIDFNQYGIINKNLPSASYKLTYKAKNGRGVYTFCMCPGGFIVNASSMNKHLAINGMSNYKRDNSYSNSAVIVTISSKDYGNNLFDGLNFQKELERKSYIEGRGKIPVQLYKDLKDNKTSSDIEIDSVFKGSYNFSNINNILPKYIVESLIEGIESFNKKIPGFNSDSAIVAAVESRTSSPIRIERNDILVSNILGIYPAGEGAGYAGGITTSAIDGMKVAEQIAKIYKS